MFVFENQVVICITLEFEKNSLQMINRIGILIMIIIINIEDGEIL